MLVSSPSLSDLAYHIPRSGYRSSFFFLFAGDRWIFFLSFWEARNFCFGSKFFFLYEVSVVYAGGVTEGEGLFTTKISLFGESARR